MVKRVIGKFGFLVMLALLVAVTGCIVVQDNPDVLKIVVGTDAGKQEVKSDGIDTVMLKAYDSKGADITASVTFNVKAATTQAAIVGNQFKAFAEGSYVITASKGTTQSVNAVTITATKVTANDVKTITIATTSAIVKTGASFMLPEKGTVTYNDGTTTQAALIWDKSPSTSVKGVFVFTGTVANASVKVTFTLLVEDDAPATIAVLKLAIESATAKVGTQFTLPVTAQAIMTDATTTTVAITWDKKADTSTQGAFTFKGTAANTDKYVTFVLTVSEDPKPYLVDAVLAQEKATVTKGSIFVLPAKAIGILSNAATTEVGVIWNTIATTVSTGTFNFIGTVQGIAKALKFTLTVEDEAATITALTLVNDKATVNIKGAFTLPSTALATMSDSSTQTVAVTWDKTPVTAAAGTFTFIGTAAGTTKSVKFTLTVNDPSVKKIVLADLAAPVKAGEEFAVTVSAMDIATAVGTMDIRIKYDAAALSLDTSNGITLLVADTGLKIIKENTPGELIITFSPKDTNINNKAFAAIKFKALKEGTTFISTGNSTTLLGTDSNAVTGVDISDVSTVIVGKVTPVVTTVVLAADKTTIKNDNTDTATLSVEVRDQFDAVMTGETVAITKDGAPFTGKTFKSASEGTAVFSAKAGGVTSNTVTIKVANTTPTITAIALAVDNGSVVVNGTFTLPATAVATMSDNSTKNVALTWDKTVSTAAEGKFVFTGSAAGTDKKVTFTLTVYSATKSILALTSANADTGTTFDVTISGKNFTQKSGGADITLTFNSQYVGVDGDASVTLLGGLASGNKIVKTEAGKITISSVVFGTTADLNGNIIKVTFKALKAGTTAINIGAATIVDSTGSGSIANVDTSSVSTVVIKDNTVTPKLLINDGAAQTGATTEITLTGKDFTADTKGVDVTLTYDSQYLTVEDAVNSVTLLGTIAGGTKIVNASAGKIKIAAVIYGKQVTANQDLLKVKFKALKAGNPVIAIASADITDAAGTAVISNVNISDTATVAITGGTLPKKLDISDAAAVNTGDNVIFKINAANITDAVSSMDVRVKYDPAYLSLDINTGITLLVADTGLKIIKENTAGEAIVTFSPKDTNINNKDLFSITFKALKAGNTSITLGSSTAIIDSALASVAVDKTDVSNLTINGGTITPVVTKVILSADKTTIKPDGTETATFTTSVLDQNGNAMTGQTVTITKDGAAFTGTTFKSAATGSFVFVAKVGTVASDAVTIKAETVVVTSGYSTNGKGVGKNKTITIDGQNTASEWTDDMLIATGLAGDDPRTLGSSWSMHETPWNATHMWAAWDDANLYVAWQYVDVTDIADPSNAGSAGGTRIFGMNLIQWLAFDTKTGSGASIDMWGKNGGKPYWTGADKPETQIYLASNFTQGYICNAVNDVFTVPAAGATSTDYKKLISSGGYNYSTGAIQNKQILVTGFDAAVGSTFAGTSLMGVKDADDRLTEAKYVDMLAAGHDKKRDTFYEVKIPLTELKITKAQLETTGIGIMMGQGEFSCMDTLPNDSATSDTKTVSESNSPLEWADVDSLSVPFARVGHAK